MPEQCHALWPIYVIDMSYYLMSKRSTIAMTKYRDLLSKLLSREFTRLVESLFAPFVYSAPHD